MHTKESNTKSSLTASHGQAGVQPSPRKQGSMAASRAQQEKVLLVKPDTLLQLGNLPK